MVNLWYSLDSFISSMKKYSTKKTIQDQNGFFLRIREKNAGSNYDQLDLNVPNHSII